MTILLSKDQYTVITTKLTYHIKAVVDDKYQPSKNGRTLETVNPVTGEVLTNVFNCDASNIDYAIYVVRKAFDFGE